MLLYQIKINKGTLVLFWKKIFFIYELDFFIDKKRKAPEKRKRQQQNDLANFL